VWAISELFPALTKPEPVKVAVKHQPKRPSWLV
jgi:hypothetical protein